MKKMILILEDEKGGKTSYDGPISDDLYNFLLGFFMGKSLLDVLTQESKKPEEK